VICAGVGGEESKKTRTKRKVQVSWLGGGVFLFTSDLDIAGSQVTERLMVVVMITMTMLLASNDVETDEN
jgi:hypothetical protein